ncbi:MAG: radical SAM protein [Parcubacteria group bacterium]|jgi:radical SAM protein with 4Fe4S-binding SPASM domain
MKDFIKINPNILLTEKCNLSCSYCFAKNEMAAASKKEMDLVDFEKILNFLENNNEKEVRLMGGEPTLHSRFKEIIELVLSRNLRVMLFTNGIFSEELAFWMASKGPSIRYAFNITAAIFASETIRTLAEQNLKFLKKTSTIYGNITIDSMRFDDTSLVDFVRDNEIDFIRLGIANNMIPNKLNSVAIQYERVVAGMMGLIMRLKQTGASQISLNCGFTPCMFQPYQMEQLRNEKVKIRGWGCQGKLGTLDISADLSAFPCFATDNLKARNILSFTNLKKVKNFSEKIFHYQADHAVIYSGSDCRKCSYFKKQECSGPCIGYVKNNELNKQKMEEFEKSTIFKIIKKLLYISRNWS